MSIEILIKDQLISKYKSYKNLSTSFDEIKQNLDAAIAELEADNDYSDNVSQAEKDKIKKYKDKIIAVDNIS